MYRVSMWNVKSNILKNAGQWSPPSKAQQLLIDVHRRETKKRLQRAQATRAISKRNPRQFRRRNRARSNRHIFTNKDMRM